MGCTDAQPPINRIPLLFRLGVRGIAAILAAAVCACAADVARSNESVTVSDPPTDAPIKLLDAATLAAAPALTLDEIFRVDGETGSEVKLSYVPEIDYSGDTAIVVLEGRLPAILIYDTTGTLVRQIGRKGRGPGEFEDPRVMTVTRDTIFVIDMMTESISLISTDGVYVDRLRIHSVAPDGRPTSPTYVLAHTPAGFVGFFHVPSPHPPMGREHVKRDTILVQRIERVAGTVQTLVTAEHPEKYRNGFVSQPAWLVSDPQLTVSPSGTMFISRPAATSIDVHDSTGRHMRRITFAPERRKVTAADVDALLARSDSVSTALEKKLIADQGSDEHPGPSTAETMRKARRFVRTIPHAEFYPVVGRILAFDTGELLVERTDLGGIGGDWRGAPGATKWDILDSSGEVVGRLELPPRFVPEAARGRTIVGVQTNEDEVPSVIAYRIR